MPSINQEIDRLFGGGIPRDRLSVIADVAYPDPWVEPVWITHDWRCPKDENHEDGANCVAPCCSPDCVCKPPPRRREAIEAAKRKRK